VTPVVFSETAEAYINGLPTDEADYLHRAITALAEVAHYQMLVKNPELALIEQYGEVDFRVMKMYAKPPGRRAIFFIEQTQVVVAKVAPRDQNPYGDGG
jgi:hypothetical protein